jgi:cytochrome b561
MKKATMLKTANLLVAIAFAVLATTSAVSKVAPDLSEVFFEIHELTGYVFFLLVVIHIVLNWSWVKANFFKRRMDSKPTR